MKDLRNESLELSRQSSCQLFEEVEQKSKDISPIDVSIRTMQNSIDKYGKALERVSYFKNNGSTTQASRAEFTLRMKYEEIKDCISKLSKVLNTKILAEDRVIFNIDGEIVPLTKTEMINHLGDIFKANSAGVISKKSDILSNVVTYALYGLYGSSLSSDMSLAYHKLITATLNNAPENEKSQLRAEYNRKSVIYTSCSLAAQLIKKQIDTFEQEVLSGELDLEDKVI